MDGMAQRMPTRDLLAEPASAPPNGRGAPEAWLAANRASALERLGWLTRTIEAEIIPRLMLAHQAGAESSAREVGLGAPPDAAQANEFTELILHGDNEVVAAYVEDLYRRGVSLESLYMALLAPVAQRLGEMWCEDVCDFTTVTLGLGRLHHVLREYSHAFPSGIEPRGPGLSVLFMPVCGEQHTLGLVMLEEFFSRAGWNVCSELSATRDALGVLVHREWFDVVGLSAGCETRLEDLTEDIRRIRKVSRNRSIVVMVGGPLFVASPELAARVGADATAADGLEALACAQRLLFPEIGGPVKNE